MRMFTGIVEKTVRISGVATGPSFHRVTLALDWPDLQDGQSIAVNGVCLTVAEHAAGLAGFDVVAETLARTNLGLLQIGDDVHVERSLRIGDRLDGHFVQGHVDGPARLVEQRADENQWLLTLESTPELIKYVSPKGSVTLDGVSLTVAKVSGSQFQVALIPTTLRLTTLGRRAIGWPFNLECDILAKTVISWLERGQGKADDGGES
jgi:riboflavin synthase